MRVSRLTHFAARTIKTGVAQKGSEKMAVTLEPIVQGEIIFETAIDSAPLLSEPNMYSVQVSSTQHIVVDSTFSYTQHSCDPNAKCQVRNGCLQLVATRDIELIHDEDHQVLSFDYDLSEWHMSHPFDCQCKSDQCRGRIAGFKHLSEEKAKELLKHALPHVQQMYERKT